MNYFEDKLATKSYREDYLNSIISFSKKDHEFVLTNDKITNELGYPLNLNNDDISLLKKELLSKEDKFDIYRITFLVLGEIKFTGLLFEVNKDKPLIIMQHGYLGTPEIMSNLYEDRDSSNYNDIVKRLLNLNVNVFCPQLLMWSVDNYGVNYDRPTIDNELRKNHSSLVGLETYILKSVISYFSLEKYPYIDMFGMSYGACMTYYVSLFTKKVKTFWGCSYLITNIHFPELNFATPLTDIITKAFKSNNLYLTFGDNDPIIKEETKEFVRQFDCNKVVCFPGVHEVYKDDNFLAKII